MPALNASAYQSVTLDRVDVAYIDYGGDPAATPIVLVHGLAGSTAHWAAVGPALARSRRVLALDLAGFGRTNPGTRKANIWSNQRLVDRFIEGVVGRPAVVVGSSMGGIVTLLQGAKAPRNVAALVLVDAAGPHTLAHYMKNGRGWTVLPLLVPWIGEKVLTHQIRKLPADERVRRLVKIISADARRVDPMVVDAWIAIARAQQHQTWPARSTVQTIRSIMRVFWLPTYRQIVDAVRAPTLVMHGRKDPIVPLSASEWLIERRPDWKLELFADVGHAPQMEAPAAFVDSLNRFLAGLDD